MWFTQFWTLNCHQRRCSHVVRNQLGEEHKEAEGKEYICKTCRMSFSSELLLRSGRSQEERVDQVMEIGQREAEETMRAMATVEGIFAGIPFSRQLAHMNNRLAAKSCTVDGGWKLRLRVKADITGYWHNWVRNVYECLSLQVSALVAQYPQR